ncbi:MAG TPA: metalloregulator ArsR/SmtB family transcription factor [Acidimicrobiales bacterium]|nr:metalloregulator ArsR/SmtB family transcription factor [Acidimicrobiales bacterium]
MCPRRSRERRSGAARSAEPTSDLDRRYWFVGTSRSWRLTNGAGCARRPHPARIVARLRQGAASVGEIAAGLPVSRPAVSQHLRALRASEVVDFDTHGTKNVYRLNPTGLVALRSWPDGFSDEPLQRFSDHVHRQKGQGRG